MDHLRFSYKHMILYSVLTLFLLFITESIFVFSVTKKNNCEISLTQHKNDKEEFLSDIYAKIILYHTCKNDNSTDSFFELKIINNSENDFGNWKITIPFTGNIEVKKSINANTEIKDNNIIFTPSPERSNIIKANTVDFIQLYLTHPGTISYDSINIKGNKIRHLTSYPLHIIIIVLSSIIVIAMIIYSLVYSYMKREIDVLNRITKRSYAIIDQTMKTFVNFIDAKDQYTKGHSTRVAEYAKAIAKRMGYDEQFQQDIYYMGLMHDIGKISVPDTILNKTTHLSADEWAVIQMHTQNGANLLRNFTIIPEIRDAVLYHHERYDGKGYLAQLKGEEIPLCARIICVADSYDAMNTNRCYRLKYSKERIIKEFERCSARQFDPTIASIMIELISDGTL